ncbi:hypothetical protein H7U20_11605 [Rugamonas sp. CCM 8940]|uniref:hypothetical protein n=1 Tax=Rugamonas sp. CCM 8940 TaxID=2765359 RepID=UPI0018F7014D|nr:hypothetical protein [Rugamonas sp. CCM 8940]MBJ7310837.1 hypothetical protein [Rugamonas sp. CCM 8940]
MTKSVWQEIRTMHSRRKFGLALLSLWPACSGAMAAPRRTIVLTASADMQKSMQGIWLTLIYEEAFRRLGLGFELLGLPAKRSSAMSDHGQVDGEISRPANYAQTHPNLLRVDIAPISASLAAYATQALVLRDNWGGLPHASLRIEYRAGVNTSENILPGRVDPAYLSSVSTTLQGLRKLAIGRTDIYIDSDDAVEQALLAPEFQLAKIHKVAIMGAIPVYAFLHKKNVALVPRLAVALTAMKREGLIETYRRQALVQASKNDSRAAE